MSVPPLPPMYCDSGALANCWSVATIRGADPLAAVASLYDVSTASSVLSLVISAVMYRVAASVVVTIGWPPIVKTSTPIISSFAIVSVMGGPMSDVLRVCLALWHGLHRVATSARSALMCGQ